MVRQIDRSYGSGGRSSVPDAIVAVTSYGEAAASTRVRVSEWLKRVDVPSCHHWYLGTKNNSARTLIRSPLGVARAEYRLRQVAATRRPDRLLLARQASPLSRGRVEASLLRTARWGVYDFDDALYLDTGAPFPKSEIWRRSVRAADVVIAGNAHLAERAADLNRNTVVIPSCVDPSQYRIKQSFHLHDPPRALWLGSPSTEMYLADIAEPLIEANRLTGLRLIMISSGDQSMGRLEYMTDRLEWNPRIESECGLIADFGIMPLAPDPWSAGKCAYKLLQYAAAALPIVGSPIGLNAEVLEGVDGLAPTTAGEWLTALLELTNEPESARQARGMTARAYIEDHYSYSVWLRTWRRVVAI